MAEITFGVDGQANIVGSGLGFFGSTFGSSVQIGSYQDTTYVTNSDGTSQGPQGKNMKLTNYASGNTTNSASGTPVTHLNNSQQSLIINFDHTSLVNVQNCQLRIYDRDNINNPASGVNTKVAEVVNHNGSTFSGQGSLGVTSDAVGSGDALWWGEPWPAELVGTNNYFTNSQGVVFLNGLDTGTNTNGDARLSTAAIAGSYDSVGGTGVIVPLSDSPGSGQKQLQNSEVAGSTGPIWPKWTQYLRTTGNQATFFGNTSQNYGDGADAGNLGKTYGGTGVDTHHTWSIALSASPLSIGAKDQYGLYMSVEYV